MLARANYGQPAQRANGARLIAQLVCALSLVTPVEALHAGSVSAQLRVTARVVSSCRIATNTDAAATFATQSIQGSLNQRVVLTSHCSKHPGSADTMSVSTESREGSEAKIEVLSRAADGGVIFATGAIDETATPESKITRWGIVPMNSRMLVLTGAASGAGDPLRRESRVTLLIDY